jgi:hypothetical protein
MQIDAHGNEKSIALECWGETETAFIGSYVHYKLVTEKIGKVVDIDGDYVKVGNMWHHKDQLWME